MASAIGEELRKYRPGRPLSVLAVGLACSMMAAATACGPVPDHVAGVRDPSGGEVGQDSPDDRGEARGVRQLEASLLARIDVERRRRRLSSLAWGPELARVARQRASRAALAGELPETAAVYPPALEERFALAENLAAGDDVASIHEALMGSEPHREEILGRHSAIGVGVAVGADGGLWVSEVFATSELLEVATAAAPRR